MENRGFKRKTIEKTIRNKINTWLKTITDESLREKIKEHYIVTGGAIASMLQGDLPNDYDIYFDNVDVAADVAEYYLKQLPPSANYRTEEMKIEKQSGRVSIFIRSSGIAGVENNQVSYEYFELNGGEGVDTYLEQFATEDKGKYLPAVITTNAISLTDDIQIILRFVGAPSEIHKNFDYIHCTNWFTERNGVELNQPALESILAKELKYVGSLYPVCSLFRIRKFIRRGWSITAGEIFKIAYDCSKLNLDDISTLRDQLVGVDSAYFNEILRIIDKSDRNIDRTYLFELVNRVFDESEEK